MGTLCPMNPEPPPPAVPPEPTDPGDARPQSDSLELQFGRVWLVRIGIVILLTGFVFLIDIWKFEPLYRILSFMTLGVVLLVIGYFYNRFEEKLRRWL